MRSQPDSLDLTNPRLLRSLLARHGVALKKQLGQNFLVNPRVRDAVIAACEAGPDDGVFEIGPGAGVLTRGLAVQAKQLVAVEKDRALASLLAEVLGGADHVEVLYGDVLDLPLTDVWQRFSDCSAVHVVANLPYYVTTPILFHLLDSGVRFADLLLMVQREVADRLQAAPGGKEYGALTVAVQYRAAVESVLRVPPSAFFPPPTVESTVVRIRLLPQPSASVVDERAFFRIVRAAFSTRRKTLRNALANGLPADKPTIEHVLTAAGIDGDRRGETLSIAEFAGLANEWVKQGLIPLQ